MFQSSFPKIIFIFLEKAKNAFFFLNIGFMAKNIMPLIHVVPAVFQMWDFSQPYH